MMRIINKNSHLFALDLFLHEKFIECIGKILNRRRFGTNLEFGVDIQQQFLRVRSGSIDISRFNIFTQAFKKTPTYGCFADTAFSGNNNKSLTFRNSVGQVCIGLFVMVTQIKIRQIYGKIEWILLKIKVW